MLELWVWTVPEVIPLCLAMVKICASVVHTPTVAGPTPSAPGGVVF